MYVIFGYFVLVNGAHGAVRSRYVNKPLKPGGVFHFLCDLMNVLYLSVEIAKRVIIMFKCFSSVQLAITLFPAHLVSVSDRYHQQNKKVLQI